MNALLNIRHHIFLTLLFLLGIASLNIAQTASVFIQPVEQNISVDSTTTIKISISDVNDLRSYSITLLYDSNILDIVDVNELTFFSGHSTLFFPNINSDQSKLLVDAAILGAGSQTGSGDLFEVEFHATDASDVTLNLQNIVLRDSQNNDIPFTTSGAIIRIRPVTSVVESVNEKEKLNALSNYPNPFNNSTFINYYSNYGKRIDIKVFSILGKEVYSETDERMFIGEHNFNWNGKSNFGIPLASGIYLITIREKNKLFTRKITLLK